MQTLTAFLAHVIPPQTPVLVIRRAALMANLNTMQSACDAVGVRLRAHGKMHKCSTLGRLQVAGGAVGLCCQTIGEAEAYAPAGIPDLLITAPLPPWAWPRLSVLAAGGKRIAAVVDSAAQIALAQATGADLTLFVDVDLGQHRAGVAPAEAAALAGMIAATPNLRFGGIQAYCGHLQHVADKAARMDGVAAATRRLRELVAELTSAGLAPAQVTGGGTGSYALDLANGVYTEIQAGSYALMDVQYGDCGGPQGEWPFQPALFAASTVVSTRHPGMVTCDAGLKALYTDGPAARVIAGAAVGSRWRSMGDEHGAIIHPDFLDALRDGTAIDAQAAAPADAPVEGALVWLQPGHVDPTVALHDAFFVADEDGRLERWPIDARRISA
jgi:3-hydroxy-D-aspartate aldolase